MKDPEEGRKLSATSKQVDGKGDGREDGRKKREGRWEIENGKWKVEALRPPGMASYAFRQEGW
jgi:hypothetical protein